MLAQHNVRRVEIKKTFSTRDDFLANVDNICVKVIVDIVGLSSMCRQTSYILIIVDFWYPPTLKSQRPHQLDSFDCQAIMFQCVYFPGRLHGT